MNKLQRSFYEFMKRFVDHDGLAPMTRLANIIHHDIAFPKQSTDFNEISNYLESHSDYSALLTVFDDAWIQYQLFI